MNTRGKSQSLEIDFSDDRGHLYLPESECNAIFTGLLDFGTIFYTVSSMHAKPCLYKYQHIIQTDSAKLMSKATNNIGDSSRQAVLSLLKREQLRLLVVALIES